MKSLTSHASKSHTEQEGMSYRSAQEYCRKALVAHARIVRYGLATGLQRPVLGQLYLWQNSPIGKRALSAHVWDYQATITARVEVHDDDLNTETLSSH